MPRKGIRTIKTRIGQGNEIIIKVDQNLRSVRIYCPTGAIEASAATDDMRGVKVKVDGYSAIYIEYQGV